MRRHHGFQTRLSFGVLTAAVAILSTLGCGSSSHATAGAQPCTGAGCTAVAVQSLTVTPATSQLAAGAVQPLSALAGYTDGTQVDVSDTATWTTSDAAIVSLSGCTARAVATGAATISASFAGLSAAAQLTVSPAALVSIDVEPQLPTLPALYEQQFSATGIYTDGTSADLTAQVTWSVGDTSVASISAAGLVQTAAAGTTAIAAALGDVTGSTTLTVTAATLTSILVDPPVTTIQYGTTTSLTATALYSDGSELDVTARATWTSGAGVELVTSSRGDVFAKGTIAGATSYVRADFGGLSGSSTITVGSAALVSLAITSATGVASVPPGISLQLVLTGTFQDASTSPLTDDPEVVWTSSDKTVATVSKGSVQALKPGSVTVSAALGSVSTSQAFAVTVTAATVQSVSVSPATASIPVGGQIQFTASATFTDGSTWDVTPMATWASANQSAALVSTSDSLGTPGLATGVAQGSTTISATFQGASASATLSVGTVTLLSITVSPDPFTVAVGKTQQMVATAHFSDGTTQNVTRQSTWTSSDRSLAWVSKKGLVTGVAAGQPVKITAKKGNKKASATGAVTP